MNLLQYAFAYSIPVLLLGLFIGSIYWVWGDAELRGKDGLMVSLMVLFTWPIGLLVWLALRPPLLDLPSDRKSNNLWC